MLAAPLVKLIMAGTRPIVCRAKNVTATPAEFGSMTPTAPPCGRERLELGAQHLGAQDQLAVAELGAQRIAEGRLARVARLPRIDQRRKQGAIEARRLDGGVDHDVLQRQARGLPARLALERRGPP